MLVFKDPNIHPDKALKRLLEGKVTIVAKRGLAAEDVPVMVYGQAERPETELPDEFIDIMINGATRAMGANPTGLFRGSVALAVYCRAKSDGTVKRNRIDRMVSQVWRLTNGSKTGCYVFSLNPQNVITPASVNTTTGYSVTVLNVEWRADPEGQEWLEEDAPSDNLHN